MNREKILEAIEIRKRCVAVAYDRKRTYFALSGSDQSYTDKVARNVRSILGPNSERCLLKDAFTLILYSSDLMTRIMSDYYKRIEVEIYSFLYAFNRVSFTFQDYLDSKIFYKPYMGKLTHIHSLRNYSCAERKILGKVGKNSIKIYVGMNPCYYCLPAIRNVVFLSREKHILQKMAVYKRKNTFFYKIF